LTAIQLWTRSTATDRTAGCRSAAPRLGLHRLLGELLGGRPRHDDDRHGGVPDDLRCARAEEDPRDGPPYYVWTPLLDAAAIRLRGGNYAKLGARRGYRLLCDGAHLAEAGAALVAETMLPAVRILLQE